MSLVGHPTLGSPTAGFHRFHRVCAGMWMGQPELIPDPPGHVPERPPGGVFGLLRDDPVSELVKLFVAGQAGDAGDVPVG